MDPGLINECALLVLLKLATLIDGRVCGAAAPALSAAAAAAFPDPCVHDASAQALLQLPPSLRFFSEVDHPSLQMHPVQKHIVPPRNNPTVNPTL